MNDDMVKYIIARILENISSQELQTDSDFVHGEKLAFYETLDIIKSELIAHDYDPGEFGIGQELEALL